MPLHSKEILRVLIDPSESRLVGWSPEDLRAILAHQLDASMMAEVDELATAGGMDRDSAVSLITASDCSTYGELLRSPSPSCPLLNLVKAMAKRAMGQEGDIPCDVARVIYVSAILAARRVGHTAITTLADVAVEAEARRCLTFAWLPGDVRALLRAN